MKGAQCVFDAIGTHWQIDIYQEITDDKKSVIFDIIKKRVEEFESIYSRFRKDSLFYQISQKEGEYKFPDDAKELFAIYHKLYDITGGLVTPLIGNVLSSIGYDREYSFEKKHVSKPKNIDNVFTYEHPILITKEKTILDFGAIGKGYIIDIVGEILEENNINSYCVDAGGDMRHRSEIDLSLNIGLENPIDVSQVLGVYKLKNKSICGSSGARRSWGEYNHIVNPDTLSSPKEILAVWATADRTVIADAMTSCLFFVSPQILNKHFEFEYAIVYKDFSLEYSKNFEGEFFT